MTRKWPLQLKVIGLELTGNRRKFSWLIIFNLTAYNSQKLFKFYNHLPHDMEMCRAGDFFKVLLKFKQAATDQLHIFLEAQKLKLKVKLFKMNNHISTL